MAVDGFVLACSLSLLLIVLPATEARSFTIDKEHNTFLKDGEPFR